VGLAVTEPADACGQKGVRTGSGAMGEVLGVWGGLAWRFGPCWQTAFQACLARLSWATCTSVRRALKVSCLAAANKNNLCSK
jgi:hypothetical protein